MSDGGVAQRIRLIFAKGQDVKYVSHLGVMRAWERIVRRADLPVAYSQGFNQRPKLSFASALAVGYTGRREVLDLELKETVLVENLLSRLNPQLPPGFRLHSAAEVPLHAASTQSLLRYSVYEVIFSPRLPAETVCKGLASLLSSPSLSRRREVKGHIRDYDLRPLIHDLWHIRSDDKGHVVGMVLVNQNSGAGRVDEVADELGLSQDLKAVERTHLIFEGDEVDWTTIKRYV